LAGCIVLFMYKYTSLVLCCIDQFCVYSAVLPKRRKGIESHSLAQWYSI